MRFSHVGRKDGIVKCLEVVTPAQAGVHNSLKQLDPRLRGDDEKITSATYYELIKKRNQKKTPIFRNARRGTKGIGPKPLKYFQTELGG